jgi:hypothetical protein
MPAPLTELHRVLASAPSAIGQNILLQPNELRLEGGRLVFYRENQGVCEWATELTGNDPPVWMRACEPGDEWKRLDEPLSGFAIQLVLAEAIMCSECGASTVLLETRASAQLLERLTPLPIGEWMWVTGNARFYARGSALVQIAGSGSLEVMLAAREPSDLDFVEDLVDASWDRVAF